MFCQLCQQPEDPADASDALAAESKVLRHGEAAFLLPLKKMMHGVLAKKKKM